MRVMITLPPPPKGVPFSIRAYAGGKHPTVRPLDLVIWTTHGNAASRNIEIAAFRGRMAKGEIAFIEVLDHENATTETVYS